jgi:hypothetical protein
VRRLPLARLAAAILLAALIAPAGSAEAGGYTVRVRVRHPDGREETRIASEFRFVYYDRRFIRKSTGFGKKPRLEIRDLRRDANAVQHDDLTKIRFSKIRAIRFEYRELEGQRLLHLVVERKKDPEVVWPVLLLRNAAVSRTPHFRGEVEGETVDFALPPILESEAPDAPSLLAVEFEFPGQPPRRKRF